jgi:hypothetical protein
MGDQPLSRWSSAIEVTRYPEAMTPIVARYVYQAGGVAQSVSVVRSRSSAHELMQ